MSSALSPKCLWAKYKGVEKCSGTKPTRSLVILWREEMENFRKWVWTEAEMREEIMQLERSRLVEVMVAWPTAAA